MAQVAEPEAVLEFWRKQPKKKLFVADPGFDEEVRTAFGPTLDAAKRGELEHWRIAPRSMMAYIIVLDQFSRNLHRNTKEMYAADKQAVEAAAFAVDAAQKYHLEDSIKPDERMWFYMPFMHSENLAHQDTCVRLFKEDGASLEYAESHRTTIKQFGRFPYRNEALGRPTTPEEQKYLDEKKK